MPDDPSLPTVVTKAYDVLLWGVKHVGKFPRSHRFVLGERIETAMLDTVLLLVEASYVGVIRQGKGGQLLCIPRRRVTDTSLPEEDDVPPERRYERGINRVDLFLVETSRWDVYGW
jgi:hypothetical protein